MQLPSLRDNNRNITTPFGLLGTDENALSFALGYTLQQCPSLLQWFLGQIGIPGIRRTSLAEARIELQRHRKGELGDGVTDIEIRVPGSFHVIVEAKVGLSVPNLAQCQKYLPRLTESNEYNQRLVALVQSADMSIEQRYTRSDSELKDRLRCFHWSQFIPKCVDLIEDGRESVSALQAVRWFYTFLDQEYHMKAFTTEVWILPTSSAPLWPGGWSFLDTHLKCHVYYDHRHHSMRPLYIGFQGNGQVTAIHRVLSIEHETPPIKYVPQLSNVKAEWPRSPHTIWRLDKPVALPAPIPSGGNIVHRRKVSCDMDVLLSGKSVLEIENRMRERRGTGE